MRYVHAKVPVITAAMWRHPSNFHCPRYHLHHHLRRLIGNLNRILLYLHIRIKHSIQTMTATLLYVR